MRENKRKLIDRYFDAADVKLTRKETNLLYKVLSRADEYDGFFSETYVSCRRSREVPGTIIGADYRRYKIIFAGADRLRIDCTHRYEGEDGTVEDAHWDWDHAETTGYDIREVLECLQVFDWEL